jgi:hypothetical protein
MSLAAPASIKLGIPPTYLYICYDCNTTVWADNNGEIKYG